jgi:hypothetical protein
MRLFVDEARLAGAGRAARAGQEMLDMNLVALRLFIVFIDVNTSSTVLVLTLVLLLVEL